MKQRKQSVLTSWMRTVLLSVLALVAVVACTPDGAQVPSASDGNAAAPVELKFGVGPYFPTPNETRDQFEPLFTEIAGAVGATSDVTVTEDWVGLSEALRAGTLDAAWLGPWGFVLARHNSPEIEAIATVEYQSKPFYYSVLMARADAPFDTLDEAIAYSQSASKPLKLSLADVGSTSGWLIPTAEFVRRGLDPKAIFDYSEGASHAAQAIAVVSAQVDMASDYNRNLDVLAATDRIDLGELKIVWQSEPLPNDPIAVRGGLSDDVKRGLQQALADLSPERAAELLPTNYTGFAATDGSNYAPIQVAGKTVGKLK
ncbi:phosphate/phosphite/phosphonate ABC transporter, periplasmic binding protein [Rubidibacter lacunae KORDI 51-2]|uniref:Phosphate/phosphite/phosphonate ABC transporter, periplasmic binding protein n=1 Tax=Rubidibacter lacunae KORDI 51-2 TaxID=582515 RepID=U5DGU1_9CHRO|nr:phosphate/phosphite/phosphonate ABC transporter substrate-binding protein [Rubidibacter lacunae]ERN40487.1 phosphate/phosphite/phosphonate ABC transporter, periplasmic binding protein [Rubidibacter lacunae KORDI 51-2]